MRERPFGVHKRQPGDCGQSPELAIYYSGATTEVPVLEFGNIVFKGGTSLYPAKTTGIGTGDGSATASNFHKLPYQNILNGGSGVKIRSCGTDLKQKVRFMCLTPGACEIDETVSVEVRAIADCEHPKWMNWSNPKEAYFELGCIETCTQKLNKLVSLFNSDPDSPVVASNVGNIYLELESKVAGVGFDVVRVQGLTEPDVIVPNFRRTYTAFKMREWFGDEIFGQCDADKCLSAIEIHEMVYEPVRKFGGTSNPATDPTHFEPVKKTVTVVFDPAITNSQSAYTALVALLNPTAYSAALDKKAASTTASDFAVYGFCVTRTDAGSPANLATAQTDYTNSNTVSVSRSDYQGGKSFYTVVSKVATAPTAVSGDTVAVGYCGEDDENVAGV